MVRTVNITLDQPPLTLYTVELSQRIRVAGTKVSTLWILYRDLHRWSREGKFACGGAPTKGRTGSLFGWLMVFKKLIQSPRGHRAAAMPPDDSGA
jgi:hypothetical protein